jgi:hypothetical protein
MPEAGSPELVASCGLYCGACRFYIKGKCKGCAANERATWCKLRSCCIEKGIRTCAECTEFPNPNDCKKFNNFMAKLFGLVFRSDRAACIARIRDLGLEDYASEMAEKNIPSIRR